MKKQKKNTEIPKNECIVYKHINIETQHVFYVGIGHKENRAFDTEARSRAWKNYTKKHEYCVEIVKRGLSWEDACREEKELILHYGRRDLGTGLLLNMTEGGDGAVGRKDTAERKKQKSLFMLENNPMNSEESRKKVSDSKKGVRRPDLQGRNAPWRTEEATRKRVAAYKNFYYNTEEGREFHKEQQERYRHILGTEETKEKAKKGRKKYLNGLTQEERSRRSEAMNKKRMTCEYCGLTTNIGNCKRWHGNNCKHRLKTHE